MADNVRTAVTPKVILSLVASLSQDIKTILIIVHTYTLSFSFQGKWKSGLYLPNAKDSNVLPVQPKANPAKDDNESAGNIHLGGKILFLTFPTLFC